MRSRINSKIFFILIFGLAQLAWLGLLGLWIYWYVSNYLILEQVGDQLSPQIDISSPNVWVFVGGILLIIALAFAITIIFRNLSLQLQLTSMYDNFIGNITHELKSPLASINLYLETLKSRNVPQEKQNQFVDYMLQDAKRLHKLINSILEISSLEQKKVSHDFQEYNADKLIRSNLANAYERYKVPADAIKIQGQAGCTILADEEAINIVIDNLIENAIKYSAESVDIHVNLECRNSKFITKITDKGIGIPSSEHKNIFKKFYRIYGEQVPSVKGTGLGLYWVKEILKHHKGKVSVQSEGINKGSTFLVELPVYKKNKN